MKQIVACVAVFAALIIGCTSRFPPPTKSIEAESSADKVGLKSLKDEAYELGEKGDPEAFATGKKLAEMGYVDGTMLLWYCYDAGIGVEKDVNIALYYLRQAVDYGDPDAIRLLGTYYAKGEGVPINAEKALELYIKSAEKGNYPAAFAVKQYNPKRALEIAQQQLEETEKAKDYSNIERWRFLVDMIQRDLGLKEQVVVPDFDPLIMEDINVEP